MVSIPLVPLMLPPDVPHHALEINDFGYPQNSEIDTLKTYITTESIMSTASAVVRNAFQIQIRRCSYHFYLRRNPQRSQVKLPARLVGGGQMSSTRRTKRLLMS